ncbi:MAG: hypothetical protein IPK85_19190 [Gemmatimonadetes bacterium]|nr:hypothetical protein [Gemmatimonadota bacterium]
MRRLSFTVFCALLACGGTQSTTGIPDLEEFTLVQAADSVPLPFGRVVKVGEVYLQLGEVADSRCPVGVQCVWAGDGVATLAVHPPCYAAGCRAASMMLVLHTGMEPRAGQGWGHRVELVALRPAPVANQVVEPSRYVAWVRVTASS